QIALQSLVHMPARIADRVLARRQGDGFTVGAVDLGMEAKVGRQPPALGRVDPAEGVAKDKGPGGRLAVIVDDAQVDKHGREAVEEIRGCMARGGGPFVRVASETEGEARLFAAGMAALALAGAMCHSQPRQVTREQLSGE